MHSTQCHKYLVQCWWRCALYAMARARAFCNRQTSLAMHIKENDEFNMCISSTKYGCVVWVWLCNRQIRMRRRKRVQVGRKPSEQYKVNPLIVRIRHGKSANNNNGENSFCKRWPYILQGVLVGRRNSSYIVNMCKRRKWKCANDVRHYKDRLKKTNKKGHKCAGTKCKTEMAMGDITFQFHK